jgi:hypothetical protein
LAYIKEFLNVAFQNLDGIYQAREYLLIIVFLVIVSWLLLVVFSMEAFGQSPVPFAMFSSDPETYSHVKNNVNSSPYRRLDVSILCVSGKYLSSKTMPSWCCKALNNGESQ